MFRHICLSYKMSLAPRSKERQLYSQPSLPLISKDFLKILIESFVSVIYSALFIIFMIITVKGTGNYIKIIYFYLLLYAILFQTRC